MRKLLLSFILISSALFARAQQAVNVQLSNLEQLPVFVQRTDWLIDGSVYKAAVYRGQGPKDLVISNGLVERSFRVSPYLACYSFRNLVTGQELLRSVKPEAILSLNGEKVEIGGVEGQFEHGYLEYNWLDSFTPNGSFRCTGFSVKEISPLLEWKPVRWIPAHTWPPKGKELVFTLEALPGPLEGMAAEIHYEVYDGIPLVSKWMKIINASGKPVNVDSFSSEILAMVEEDVSVDKMQQWSLPNIFVASNYSFMGMTGKSADRVTNWLTDSSYTSQVNYELKTPCLLECKPPVGPGVTLANGESFETFRIWELAYDSYDRERKGLATRKMYRTVAPWSLENPVFLHLTSTDTGVIREAARQCKEVGFEMIILSFGSGLNMESVDPAYLESMKAMSRECNAQGIELGGYSLLASRRINDEEDVINPKTGKTGGAVFGNSPCLESNWGNRYFRNLQQFIDKTGFSLLEHDGSYPGDVCASVRHPGHTGLYDSQWKQWEKITGFYAWCRSKDIYLNVPDWYFLAGSNKTGIGYRETNWSLPRDRQLVLGRQNLFDGTWEKTPSMGWTFVPLVQYQGGGDAATLEPLSLHLKEYQAHLFQNFGAGVQACYRGFRLYDTDETRDLVKKWVNWYKKYRLILNSDIIHLRRADGRDWDGLMHVNPALKEKGFILLFNPLESSINREIVVPLYYTGLTGTATVREQENAPQRLNLNDRKEITLRAEIQANGFTWYVIE